MKSIKPAKPAPKPRATRKGTAADNIKAVSADVAAPAPVKHAYGTSRPVMSLPPPTGQPPKVSGKSARMADSAVPRFATLIKRDAAKPA